MQKIYLSKLTPSEMQALAPKEKMYKEAFDLMYKQQYQQAYDLLVKLNDYQDSMMFAKVCLKCLKMSSQVNDTIKFGAYYQNKEVKEPIEWIVLAEKVEKMLVVSKKILDAHPYHGQDINITWEECDLRKWLNTEFINEAFSDEEQQRIIKTKVANYEQTLFGQNETKITIDKVFVLSSTEFNDYCDEKDKRKAIGSIYAVENHFKANSKFEGTYWLRDQAFKYNKAVIVEKNGDLNRMGINVDHQEIGVRVAMWIKK